MLSMSFDAGPNLFRGILRKLIDAETRPAGYAHAAAQAD
jgi:hypothetical protein